VLDTRTDVGAADIVDATPVLLTVTGSIATTTGNATVVPVGATGVVVNVTAVNPSVGGFVSLRPGDAVGAPAVSTLNVTANGIFPNGATLTLPTTGPAAGQVQIWFEGDGTGGRTDMLIDIVGYYVDHNHDDRYYTKAQSDAASTLVEEQIATASSDAKNELQSLTRLMTTPPTAISFETSATSGIGGPAFGIGTTTRGNPIISFTDDDTDQALRVISCGEPMCTFSTGSYVIDDQPNRLGPWNTLGIGIDGNPVIAYNETDGTNSRLKFAACIDSACERVSPVISVLDSAGNVGAAPSIAFNSDGNPVIAYLDITNQNLKIVACNDKKCTGGDEFRRTLTTDNDTSHFLSIGVDMNGIPLVSYVTWSGDVRLIKCLDATCSTSGPPTTIDSGTLGHLSMSMTPWGTPVMVYASSAGFKVAACQSSNCSTTPTIHEFTKTLPTYAFDVVIGWNGFPIVLFNEVDDLKAMFCADSACARTDTRTITVDANGTDGAYPAATILTNGIPVVAYLQVGPDRVKYAAVIS